ARWQTRTIRRRRGRYSSSRSMPGSRSTAPASNILREAARRRNWSERAADGISRALSAVMAGLVPAISLREAVRPLIEVTGTTGERSDAVLRTAMPGNDKRKAPEPGAAASDCDSGLGNVSGAGLGRSATQRETGL